jgi:hypothetical protein
MSLSGSLPYGEDMMKAAILFKYLLTRIGEPLSANAIYNLNASVNYLAVGRWLHANGYKPARRVNRHEQPFGLVRALIGDQRVLYMNLAYFGARPLGIGPGFCVTP